MLEAGISVCMYFLYLFLFPRYSSTFLILCRGPSSLDHHIPFLRYRRRHCLLKVNGGGKGRILDTNQNSFLPHLPAAFFHLGPQPLPLANMADGDSLCSLHGSLIIFILFCFASGIQVSFYCCSLGQMFLDEVSHWAILLF